MDIRRKIFAWSAIGCATGIGFLPQAVAEISDDDFNALKQQVQELSDTRRETAGYVYYLTNTLWFEGDYEFFQSKGPSLVPSGKWVFQLSYGF